jgi:hypothetical protein
MPWSLAVIIHCGRGSREGSEAGTLRAMELTVRSDPQPEPTPAVKLFKVAPKVAAILVLVALIGVPITIAVLSSGNIVAGLISGAVTLLGLVYLALLIAGYFTMRRRWRASGAEAENRRLNALAGPPPTAVRIVAVGCYIVGVAYLLGAVGLVVAFATNGSGWGWLLGGLFAFLIAVLGLTEFLGARRLLRNGGAGPGQVLHYTIGGLAGTGFVNALLDDKAEWQSKLIIGAVAAVLLLLAYLPSTPAARAWILKQRITPPTAPVQVPPQPAGPAYPPPAQQQYGQQPYAPPPQYPPAP